MFTLYPSLQQRDTMVHKIGRNYSSEGPRKKKGLWTRSKSESGNLGALPGRDEVY